MEQSLPLLTATKSIDNGQKLEDVSKLNDRHLNSRFSGYSEDTEEHSPILDRLLPKLLVRQNLQHSCTTASHTLLTCNDTMRHGSRRIRSMASSAIDMLHDKTLYLIDKGRRHCSVSEIYQDDTASTLVDVAPGPAGPYHLLNHEGGQHPVALVAGSSTEQLSTSPLKESYGDVYKTLDHDIFEDSCDARDLGGAISSCPKPISKLTEASASDVLKQTTTGNLLSPLLWPSPPSSREPPTIESVMFTLPIRSKVQSAPSSIGSDNCPTTSKPLATASKLLDRKSKVITSGDACVARRASTLSIERYEASRAMGQTTNTGSRERLLTQPRLDTKTYLTLDKWTPCWAGPPSHDPSQLGQKRDLEVSPMASSTDDIPAVSKSHRDSVANAKRAVRFASNTDVPEQIQELPVPEISEVKRKRSSDATLREGVTNHSPSRIPRPKKQHEWNVGSPLRVPPTKLSRRSSRLGTRSARSRRNSKRFQPARVYDEENVPILLTDEVGELLRRTIPARSQKEIDVLQDRYVLDESTVQTMNRQLRARKRRSNAGLGQRRVDSRRTSAVSGPGGCWFTDEWWGGRLSGDSLDQDSEHSDAQHDSVGMDVLGDLETRPWAGRV